MNVRGLEYVCCAIHSERGAAAKSKPKKNSESAPATPILESFRSRCSNDVIREDSCYSGENFGADGLEKIQEVPMPIKADKKMGRVGPTAGFAWSG
jgi:hypothetical protein